MTDRVELAEHIRSGGYNWQRAFDAWFIQHGAYPDIHIREDDGTRVVLRDAVEFIKTNHDYLRTHTIGGVNLAVMLQPDGALQLDSAGEYRYRPLGVVDNGFTAYERIQP